MAKSVIQQSLWGRAENAFIMAMRKRRDDSIIRKLGQSLPDPNITHITRDAEFSILFHASIENSFAGFKVLLERGANPAWANKYGKLIEIFERKEKLIIFGLQGVTVLQLCAKRNQIEMMNLAVKNMTEEEKVQVANSKSKSGWTILMAACERDNIETVKWLLHNRADPNVQMNVTHWTAMHAASKNGHVETLKLLLQVLIFI